MGLIGVIDCVDMYVCMVLRVGLEPIGKLVTVRFDGIDGFDGITVGQFVIVFFLGGGGFKAAQGKSWKV